uniref:Putative secreted peptide n=1 Tax=Anopheles braziliensis TaxID=58242 RepID=A0A2M3ZMH8_9DIPT
MRSLSDPSANSCTLWALLPSSTLSGSSTLGRYDLRSIFCRFLKQVCVFRRHWLRSSGDRLSSANTIVKVFSSICASTRAANSELV